MTKNCLKIFFLLFCENKLNFVKNKKILFHTKTIFSENFFFKFLWDIFFHFSPKKFLQQKFGKFEEVFLGSFSLSRISSEVLDNGREEKNFCIQILTCFFKFETQVLSILEGKFLPFKSHWFRLRILLVH